MTSVQYKADYVEGDSVAAGTIILYNSQLFFATQTTNSKPDDDTMWAEIGEVGGANQAGSFLGNLFGATPKDKTPATPPRQGNIQSPASNVARTLNFQGKQAGGGRRRRTGRRTVKKPRRK